MGGQAPITLAHAAPVVLVVLALGAVASGFRAGAGRWVLTAIACMIKVTTVVAIVWALTHPGGFGPHGLLDGVPVGMANAGGGLWLKTMIQTRGRHQ